MKYEPKRRACSSPRRRRRRAYSSFFVPDASRAVPAPELESTHSAHIDARASTTTLSRRDATTRRRETIDRGSSRARDATTRGDGRERRRKTSRGNKTRRPNERDDDDATTTTRDAREDARDGNDACRSV